MRVLNWNLWEHGFNLSKYEDKLKFVCWKSIFSSLLALYSFTLSFSKNLLISSTLNLLEWPVNLAFLLWENVFIFKFMKYEHFLRQKIFLSIYLVFYKKLTALSHILLVIVTSDKVRNFNIILFICE